MIIINAENLIVGRLASIAAKKALLGEEVAIVNSEKAIISGRRKSILDKMRQTVDRGTPFNGPFYPKRNPDRILRRIIRGMLPYKQERGKMAFKRVMCYIGIPDELKDKKIETIKGIGKEDLKRTKYLKLSELVKEIKA